MFTPPPSPTPPKLTFQQSVHDGCVDIADDDVLSPISRFSTEEKRATSRRTKWAVVIVPLVLILITGTTRYLTHPAVLDILSGSHEGGSLTNWQPHKRHPAPHPQVAATSSDSSLIFPTAPPTSSSASPTTTSTSTTSGASAQPVPTIPSAAPVLPTPFPQAFDSSLQANFSTQGCQNFFLNMTTSPAINSCRPFSLLLQSSQSFNEQAETNLSSLNAIVWGTCNTNLSQDVCSSDMAWFASTLQSVCSAELSKKNSMAVQTLQALQTFDLMRNAGCLPDQTTNSYCFVEAAHSTNPSDLYFYQLPIGIPLPNNTLPSCSSCVKSLLGLYAQALQNSSGKTLTDLQKSYSNGEAVAVAQCGSGYAQSLASSALGREMWSVFVSLTAIVLTWVALWSVP